MSKEAVKEIEYGIFPSTPFLGIMGSIGTFLTIYTYIEKYSSFTKIIIIFSFVVLSLAVYMVLILLRFSSVKKRHNNLVCKYNHLKKNQQALKEIIQSKNIEIDWLSQQNNTLKAQTGLMFSLYKDKKPNPENVKQALKIEEVEYIE